MPDEIPINGPEGIDRSVLLLMGDERYLESVRKLMDVPEEGKGPRVLAMADLVMLAIDHGIRLGILWQSTKGILPQVTCGCGGSMGTYSRPDMTMGIICQVCGEGGRGKKKE